MSEPLQNPLDEFSTYKLIGMIAAFRDTESAESTELTIDRSLDIGDSIGNGIIILNDAKPTPTHLIKFNHIFEWNSIRMGHTFSMGEAMIADRNATKLISFLKTRIVDNFNTSLDNITFSLRLFWVADELDNVNHQIIKSNHFYFSCPELRHTSTDQYNYLSMPMVALHDTKCQLPNYSNLYGITITNEGGNLHDTIPNPNPVIAQIIPRGEEDSAKSGARDERINLSSPMETIGDVMAGLQADLEGHNTIHRGQLQRWQSVIRDDFVDKLDPNPEQEKEIPVEYEIELNDGYDEYEIDNRNLPFEQPEQKQSSVGIRTIPTKVGEPISDTINRIMSMSTRVSDDVKDGFTYKLVSTWRRVGDVVKYKISVNKCERPINENGGKDTGPGQSAVDDGLEFIYKTFENTDVLSLKGRTAKNDALRVIEHNGVSEDGRVSYGGDREGISADREPDVDFFMSGFSGPRNFVKLNKTMGVEYPRDLGYTQLSRLPSQGTDDSNINIMIQGNPELLSDLLRRPSDVANNADGNPYHYKKIERLPMYAKLKIINVDGVEDETTPEKEYDIPEFHHNETYMHLYKVESFIESGAFFQRLTLKRRDQLI